MAVSNDYLDYVLGQLSDFGEVTVKKMFGGAGLYHDGLMFGLVTAKDVFCLKVDDTNKADYEAKGMKSFGATETKKGMPYWEVPVEILENNTELSAWTAKAYDVAVTAKSKKKKKK